jgi:hypothetical protein
MKVKHLTIMEYSWTDLVSELASLYRVSDEDLHSDTF